MRRAAILAAVSLVAACGGGGGAAPTTPPPSYPSVAGSWTGRLIGATPESSASLLLTIEQASNVAPGGHQPVHGLWTGLIGSRQVGGNFNGWVWPTGSLQFTLDQGSGECNFWMDLRAGSNRVDGTFQEVGRIGCIPTGVSPSGRVELTRE